MAPVQNRDAEANKYADWQPTMEQVASLEATREKCKGKLARILDAAKWSGHRLRVTGFRDGMPVTESIGPWHIILVPTTNQPVVEMKGLLFANDFAVNIDMDRDVLIIKDTEFQGTPLKGKSPMFQNTAFQGVVFEVDLGLTTGSASILFLDDDRLALDFHKVIVNGSKAGEYGILEPSGAVR